MLLAAGVNACFACGFRARGQGAQSRPAHAGLHQWGQSIALTFCQLGRAHCLREIWRRVGLLRGKAEAPANADKTQVWAALIAMLVLKCLQWKSKSAWSSSNLRICKLRDDFAPRRIPTVSFAARNPMGE